MRNIFQGIIGALVLLFILINVSIIGLFVIPTQKLISFVYEQKIEYVENTNIPDHVRQVFASQDYQIDIDQNSSPIGIVAGKVLDIKLNKFYSDEELLGVYLNTLDFGEDIIGIESASNYYFKKSISDLSFEESLTLLGLFRVFENK